MCRIPYVPCVARGMIDVAARGVGRGRRVTKKARWRRIETVYSLGQVEMFVVKELSKKVR